ncbi:MAG TPA: cbb3-type cytochrome c oxidase subunit II [Chryseosolibacter sp.]
MNLFNSHTPLFLLATTLFIALSIVVAIMPALYNQANNAPLPTAPLLEGEALKGKEIFIANGCVACHSQQVRNVEMDNAWGERPSIAADYAGSKRMSWWMNSATLMGTERTGPDLTNVGNRLPSDEWHLMHLFNPRIVVEESIMPSYPWLFEIKIKAQEGDRVVNVPRVLLDNNDGVVVAREEALQLVAYLKSLKQTPLPDGLAPKEFLYQEKAPAQEQIESAELGDELDGGQLYAANCQACHQANGQGMPGAFPALQGSSIVLDENPERLINIIMSGYNAREEFGEMPAIGKLNNLTPAEITAIINHERTSWGNNAAVVSEKQVEEIISLVNSLEAKTANYEK